MTTEQTSDDNAARRDGSAVERGVRPLDAELESKTGEPHVDGWPLWSGLPPPEPRVHYEGPVAFHTQRCAVLTGKHAVLDLNAGVFRPSWDAQAQGWHLVRADTWLQRLALKLFAA